MRNGDIDQISKELEQLLEAQKSMAARQPEPESWVQPGKGKSAANPGYRFVKFPGTESNEYTKEDDLQEEDQAAMGDSRWDSREYETEPGPETGDGMEPDPAGEEGGDLPEEYQDLTEGDGIQWTEDDVFEISHQILEEMKRDRDRYSAATDQSGEPAVSEKKETESTIPKRPGEGRRLKGLSRPFDGLLAAFLVPVLIMILIFIQRKIFPFGEESFLRTDMYHQYAPFFSEFQHKLKTGGSLLYSWDIGMGINFSALYAYYLASPFNWLLIFCPKSMVIEFMTYLIVLKIGLSGLSMAYYLRKHSNSGNFGVAFFGIFYALSGYMAAYSWNIMWLDCIVLFPIIALGLERLIQKKRGGLYCLALGTSILSNYYISIMICIFLVFYFVALMFLENGMTVKRFFGCCLRFGIYSLLAGGLAAAVLLPEIAALQMTASGELDFPKDTTSYFSIFDMIARHMANVKIEIGLDHWPNIYCGVAVFLFFLLYLACKKIRAKEKAVYLCLLLLFMASFAINTLNFVWHGFHFPNSLPCRQSFIYIFLVLVICFRAYEHLDTIPKDHIAWAFGGSCAFVILAQKLVTAKHFHFSVYYLALISLILYAGVIYLYKKGSKYKEIAAVLALVLVSVEAAINTTATSVTTTSRSAYIDDNQAVEKLIGTIDTNEFYRVEKVTRKTKNDGAWMHFPSVSVFSSTANESLTAFFKKLGCEGSTNAYSITGSTPLADCLFGVKYALFSTMPETSGLREWIGQEDTTYLYENLYSMPLGFLVPGDFERQWQTETGNPADIQNGLSDAVGAKHTMIQMMYGQDSGSHYSFTAETAGEYYAFVDNRRVEKVSVTKPSETKNFDNVNRGYLLELGYCEAGEEVSVQTEDTSEDMRLLVYRFSEEGLRDVYQKLNSSPMSLVVKEDTYLKGVVESEQSAVLFTTIPYEKGWKVKVDGTEYPTRKIMDAFLCVDLPSGNHTIEFTYVPEGLESGAVISIFSILMFSLITGFSHVRRKRREGKEMLKRLRKEREKENTNAS